MRHHKLPSNAGFDAPGRGLYVRRIMILPIVQYGDPVLRVKCRTVSDVDEEIRELADDMLETMYDAEGVGLAAPQIGRDIRLVVIDVFHDPECVSFLRVNGEDAELGSIMPLVCINPELELGRQMDTATEGCLSIRGIRLDVRRPEEVKAKVTLLDGTVLAIETDGLLARALQHEVDHLNGVLFTDRLSAVLKVSAKNKLKKLLADNGFA